MEGIHDSLVILTDQINHETRDQFICQVCQKICKIPLAYCSECKKIYCRQCFEPWWNVHKKCPLNHTQTKIEAPPYLYTITYHKIKVQCPNSKQIKGKDFGCEEIFPIGFYEDHLQNCHWQQVQCRGCDFKCLRKDIKDHEIDCESVFDICDICQQQIHTKKSRQHDEIQCLKNAFQNGQKKIKEVHNENQYMNKRVTQLEEQINRDSINNQLRITSLTQFINLTWVRDLQATPIFSKDFKSISIEKSQNYVRVFMGSKLDVSQNHHLKLKITKENINEPYFIGLSKWDYEKKGERYQQIEYSSEYQFPHAMRGGFFRRTSSKETITLAIYPLKAKIEIWNQLGEIESLDSTAYHQQFPYWYPYIIAKEGTFELV